MQERLQKIIARAGIASRRHAALLIASGQVRVNGRVVKELGTKADATKDRIEAAGRVVETKEGRRVYILLNKPPEVVSAMADPEGRKTLRNCLRGLPERVFPVGNLEYAASGLVFLTNDGDLAADMLKNWARLEQIDLSRQGERNADARGPGAVGKRDWREDANRAAAGRDARSGSKLLVRSADAGFEEGRAAASVVQGETSRGEAEAHWLGAADGGRDTAGQIPVDRAEGSGKIAEANPGSEGNEEILRGKIIPREFTGVRREERRAPAERAAPQEQRALEGGPHPSI